MRYVLAVMLLAALLVASVPRAGAADGATVSMSVAAGYNGYYRAGAAWVPIRVGLHNVGATDVSGTVVARGAAPSASRYSLQVVLAPGTRKDVTVFLPGTDLEGTVTVTYADGSHVLSSASAYPNPLPDTDLVIGVLSDEPDATWWLRSVHPRHVRAHIFPLSRQALDPVPEVLAGFDEIVLTNTQSSGLDVGQIAAIERYIREGGALVLVGGPSWQTTLAPLPASLLPGPLVGTRTVSDLSGLKDLALGVPPAHLTTLSVLRPERGAVLAGQSGVPLLVKWGLGNGQIEYLGFDPASAPIQGWSHAAPLLTELVAGAAPLAMRRAALLPVDRTSSFLNPGPQSLDPSSELANFPLPSFPTALIEPSMVVLFVVSAGLLALFLTRRRRITWLAVPLAAALGGGAALHVAPSVAARTSLINTVNTVYLDGSGPQYPAVRYVGVFTPTGGAYRLRSDEPALASNLPTPASYADGPNASAHPATFQQGARSAVELPDAQGGTTRTIVLRTTVTLHGHINSRLHLDRSGDLVGTIGNETNVPLREPALVAGGTYLRLPGLAPGARTRIRLHPGADPQNHEYPNLLPRIYGLATPDYAAIAHRQLPTLLSSPVGLPPERTLAQRIRNAANTLPEGHLVTLLGEVTLLAWTDGSVGDLTLDGADAGHRDLTLLIEPVSVHLPRGSFRLPEGVIGARAMDVVPQRPEYPCCGPTVQPISIGAGGSATFAFDLDILGPARLTQLSLDVYAGGADPTASGYGGMPKGAAAVFDWREHRWRPLDFKDGRLRLEEPSRYISQTGSLLLRFTATRRTGDLTILDPGQDLQVSGTGFAA